MILQWLASPEWAQVVKALLHTLWQAVAVAILLGFVLRRSANPVTRYRCSLGALAAVLVIGLVSWAVLNRAAYGNKTAPLPASDNSLSKPMEVGGLGEPATVVVVRASRTETTTTPPRWTAWLALMWLAGAGLMLARAGAQVAGAERLRRSCRPLADPRVAELAVEARRTVGLARQVRLAVTDKLTSPAVVGVIVPTLILPLSLVTTLTPEQIRFVLLHELAHIRRGDYLANLFQLFAEALLFFNPAVWWISHQVRREREACCDALAIELNGAPADYARTLVHVAESILNPPPAAAPAFGDKTSKPSSLAERVQRLLVPGYRPALRLTWRAMLTALLLGGALLVLSAVGTRVTVAEIMATQRPAKPSNGMVGTNNMATSGASSPTLSVDAARQLRAALITAEQEQTRQETFLKLLHDLKPAQFIAAVRSVSEFGELTAVLQQYHRAQDDVFLKDNHSTTPSSEYLNARKLADELGKKIDARAAVAFADLEKRAEAGRAVIKELNAKLEGAPPPEPLPSNEVERQLRTALSDLESEQARQEALLQTLQMLDPSALCKVIQAKTGPDAELTYLLERCHRTQAIAASLKDNHSAAARSEYENARKLADELDKKIDVRVNGILIGLENRAQAGRAASEQLRAKLAEAKPPDPARVASPQINIKVKFIELPEEGLGEFLTAMGTTNLVGNPPKGLTGILTASQFRTVISALERRNDADTLNEGQITTLSGRQCQIQVLDPMKLATNINPLALNPPGVPSDKLFQKTPFPIGPTLDIIPTVGPDGFTVELTLVPTVTEFLGYDPATNSVKAYVDGEEQTVPVPLPRFHLRQMSSHAVVWDGQTVVLGGLPDAPNANSSAAKPAAGQRKQLVIFVTPTIVDPTGARVHADADTPSAQPSAVPHQQKPKASPLTVTSGSAILNPQSGVMTYSGGVVVKKDGTNIIRADTLTVNPAAGEVRARGHTNLAYTSKARQDILAKLNQIRLDSVFFDQMPLAEVVRSLSEEITRRDPQKRGINFLIFPNPEATPIPAAIDPATGQPIAQDSTPGTNNDTSQILISINPLLQNVRLGELLDAIVKSADRPIRYDIQDYGIAFSAKATNEPPPLFVRKFRVDPNTFIEALQKVSGTNFEPASASAVPLVAADKTATPWVFQPGRINADAVLSACLKYFDSLGVDLSPATGKNVFFSDSRGDLLVRATAEDLDIIEKAVAALFTPPPQINFKTKFVELPAQGFDQFLGSLGITNRPGNSSTQEFAGVLTDAQFRTAIAALERRDGAILISEGQVTTLSERQAQIQVVDLRPIVFADTNGVLQTNMVPLGPVLDVLAKVDSDGRTLQMTVTPTVTEFLGYDDPGQFVIQAQGGSNSTAALPPPKYRVRDTGAKNNIAEPFPLPRLRVRQMSVQTNVLDGSTLVMGGMTAIDISRVKSKVPVLGDLPLLGQLFRSELTASQTNQLLIFVTPTIIDAAGNRVHTDE